MPPNFIVLLLTALATAHATLTAEPASFPLTQPDEPIVAAFAGPERPLFGQTPPLRLIAYSSAGAEVDRGAVLREVRYLRDYFRHQGLFLPVEGKVFDARATDGEPRSRDAILARVKGLGLLSPGNTIVFTGFPVVGSDLGGAAIVSADDRRRVEALRATGALFGLSGASERRELSPPEVAPLERRYAFAPPPPKTDPFHRPALRDYRVSPHDFEMLESGLDAAGKVSSRMFPGLLADVDVVLFDTSDLYIYSRDRSYPFLKVKRWHAYQVYRIAHRSRPEEHEMWGCSGGLTVVSADVRRTLKELYFACAPWGTFGPIQAKRGTIYRFDEGYWTSIIHEYGHQYQERMAADPTRTMVRIQDKISSMKLGEQTDADSAVREGFATWCELRGARLLFPAQYRRMLDRAKRLAKDDAWGHEAGLAAASAVETAKEPAAAP